MGLIQHNLARQVHRGIITQDAMDAARSAHIKTAPELQAIGKEPTLAIEAATENEETKKQIFKALGPAPVRQDAPWASNTSSISITRLARRHPTGPTGFIGLHFMNPPRP